MMRAKYVPGRDWTLSPAMAALAWLETAAAALNTTAKLNKGEVLNFIVVCSFGPKGKEINNNTKNKNQRKS